MFIYTVVLHALIFAFGIFLDEPAFSALPTDKSKSKSQVGNGKGDKGKGKAQNENPHSSVPYSFTEEEEEGIARWIESNKLLYDMKDIQYKDKALRRKLWEGKAAEYELNCKYKTFTF